MACSWQRLLLLLVALVLAACPPKDRPPDKEKKVSPPGKATVVLRPAGKADIRIAVEVVRSEEDRARGLMFRKELADRAGMLFIFDEQERQHFWMKNTYISLDLLFIDEAMEVVGIVHSAEPMTESRRSVDRESRYVLEVNGGFCRRNEVGEGTRVIFEGV